MPREPSPRPDAARPPVDAASFFARARNEAQRYGPDPWIFVRELLQNARDAGASKVEFEVTDDGDGTRIVCRDDGEGMTFAHAKRYLFALYASSKETAEDQVGRFGVGFWSILRFVPSRIEIRSRPRTGKPWGLRLDGELRRASFELPPAGPGTEIVLCRAAGDGQLPRRIYDAAHQNGRFLRMRDDGQRALHVTVNGQPINAPFQLPAPCTRFSRGRLRGIVGLGPAPRVELFSRGLRIRSAACLEDLLSSASRTANARVAFPEIPGGLAPQALLESDELQLMLSRTDARDDRALRKLVRIAQRELQRLLERQFAHARDDGWWRRMGQQLIEGFRVSVLWRAAVAAGVGGLLALILGWMAWDLWPMGPSTAETSGTAVSSAQRPPRPYTDLSERYRGPRVDPLRELPAALALQYEPPEADVHFAALRFSRIADDGPRSRSIGSGTPPAYRGVRCEDGCITISMEVSATGAPLRLPVPTGMRVVDDSVRFEGASPKVLSSPEGLPMIETGRLRRGTVRYQVAPASETRQPPTSPPALPEELQVLTTAARSLPVDQRVDMLRAHVARAVRYDRSTAVVQAHEQAPTELAFIQRTLRIGAGDCDIQNALLVALLQSAGIQARLAVGPVGRAGRVLPWLHAWVEYRDTDDQWKTADASTGPTTVPLGPSVADVATGSDSDGTEGNPEITDTRPDPTDRFGLPAVVAARETPTEGPGRGSQTPWLWLTAAVVPMGLGGWLVFAARTRRSVELEGNSDLSGLLVGALQRPAAFGHLPMIYRRKVVPLLGGRFVSLDASRTLAERGRLYRSTRHGRLPQNAARAGAVVLDARQPEGKSVADALGAIDLDGWQAIIGLSYSTPLLDRLDQLLRAQGTDWAIRLIDGGSESVATLDLSGLGVQASGIRSSRITVIDSRDALARGCRAAACAAAELTLLDELTERVGFPSDERGRLLAAAARRVLDEAEAR